MNEKNTVLVVKHSLAKKLLKEGYVICDLLPKKDTETNSFDYKYPHNYGGYVEQQYLPDSLKDKVYYTPNNRGYEKEVQEIRKRKGKKQ